MAARGDWKAFLSQHLGSLYRDSARVEWHGSAGGPQLSGLDCRVLLYLHLLGHQLCRSCASHWVTA